MLIECLKAKHVWKHTQNLSLKAQLFSKNLFVAKKFTNVKTMRNNNESIFIYIRKITYWRHKTKLILSIKNVIKQDNSENIHICIILNVETTVALSIASVRIIEFVLLFALFIFL